ncbi:hypothetical protein [Microbacterium suwonense]|uniref:Transcriptional regulator, AbiEi antitoxin, Type IV TA system n=1 Tax=Microbacterium suwonense TaxID=683047 RepID=A0ABN6X426_9MICO|nr:hypothetical protein [Microbacterium suwonense]BDZ38702.1 hypothetical protein GCM10025863_13160 [Microbacterium suwonense]
MPKDLDLPAARLMLRTREDLLAGGMTERDIAAQVTAKLLIRIRRGRYVSAVDWDGLWNEGRHLLQVLAFHLNARAPGPLFWGPSAAVLHGLPLYRLAPTAVHVVILGERHSRSRTGIAWHDVGIADADMVEIDGIRCTSLDRTVLDMARSFPEEVGVSVADAALRREAVTGHVQDRDRAEHWRGRMLERALTVHTRGIRSARRLIEFADGRAQLPGESVSRLQLDRLGYRGLDLQVHVVGPDQEDYWMDFGFPRSRVFGEFDGRGKYLQGDLRGDRAIEDVILDEKRREDIVRGVTGWRTTRWASEHIRTLDVFARRLQAFGLRPPG